MGKKLNDFKMWVLGSAKLFWRVLWTVVTLCWIVIAACLVETCNRRDREDKRNSHYTMRISPNMEFYTSYKKSMGSIRNILTHEVMIDKVGWYMASDDSLAVYCRKRKRGYFNRFTGEVAIKCKYDAAWVFSEGVAAVAEGNDIYFIDHDGNRVMGKKTFPRKSTRQGYCFHGGYCAVANSDGKVGLINRKGDWVIEPKYDEITSEDNNYWIVSVKPDKYGVVNDSAKLVYPCEYSNIDISADGGIAIAQPDRSIVAYNFDGTKRDEFVCKNVWDVYYDTDDLDVYGVAIKKKAANCVYQVFDGYVGLLGVDGKPVTAPLYKKISAIDANTYFATYDNSESGVMLSGDGNIIKR